MRNIVLLAAFLYTATAFAQTSHRDSIEAHQLNYVQKHGVVKGDDKKYLSFFSYDPSYKVLAKIQVIENSPWFKMKTSGVNQPLYRIFGVAHFDLNGQHAHLNIYQSQDLMENDKYKHYLFLPFTDATNGEETYEGGRYLDFTAGAIQNGLLYIDFNKAYNPYCAYVSDIYNCPIPPPENRLPFPIRSGEKAYAKPH